MVSWCSGESKPGAGDGHLRGLQRGVVGGGEATVVGQFQYCGVFKVPKDESAQIFQLFFGWSCGYGLYVLRGAFSNSCGEPTMVMSLPPTRDFTK